MDRFYNSKRQNMSNYLDIFKACRLCGSGGGYKMPIIQKLHGDNVIDVEAELKQKIRECVSIDVHPDDRMPPLICELCVDKVNDFYEFREMCRATNARVRASLGLPHQNLTQDINEDCILGVSGPVFHNSKEGESKKDSKNKNIKKVGGSDKKSLRSSEPMPPILDRSSRRRHTDSPQLGGTAKKLRFSSPASSSGSPLTEKKKHNKGESLAETSRKLREGRTIKPIEPKKGNLLQKQKELLTLKTKDQTSNKLRPTQKSKQVKEPLKPKETREAQKSKKVEPKAKEIVLKKKTTPPVAAPINSFKCEHCSESFAKQLDYKQHVNFMHFPLFTDEKLSCTPCGEWFASLKDADAHHKWHKNSNTYYSCQRCSTDFKVLMGFVKHFQRRQCLPYDIVPDVKCSVCMGMFATENWMKQHKCPGPPKNMCKKCLSIFQDTVSLRRHEKRCKGIIVPLNPNNPHLQEIRPLSIDIQRCDNLVRRIKTEPGLLTTFKQEPMDFEESPIQIKQEIKQEMEDYNSDFGDYGMDRGGYSSDGSVSETDAHQAPHMVINPFARKNSTQVESLSIISLRSIFGGKLLGKRTRRKRKTKNPKLEMLHSIENATSTEGGFDSLFDNNHTSAMHNDDRPDGETTDHDANMAEENAGDFANVVVQVNNNDVESAKESSVLHSTDNQDFIGEKNNETLAENVPNENIQKTDLETDSQTVEECIEEKTGDVIDNANTTNVTSLTSQTSEIGANSDVNDDDKLNNSLPVDQTNLESNNITDEDKLKDEPIQNNFSPIDQINDEILPKSKVFEDGFALDPEVEALLMEDEEVTTDASQTQHLIIQGSTLNNFSLSETSELVDNTIDKIHDDFESLPFEGDSQEQTHQTIDQGEAVPQEDSQFSVEDKQVSENLAVENTSDIVLEEQEERQSHDKEIVSNNADSIPIESNEDKCDDDSSTELEAKKNEDVLDLVSDSGDDCNILDSPDKLTNSNTNQLLDEDVHKEDNELTELLTDDKQVEESLLDGKDNCCSNEDTEMSQQDEELLLGKDDPDELSQTAQDDYGQDLEKISDGEFDID